MPSFYTPGYTENASFSHPVWGMPLPSMADMGASKPGAPGTGSTHMPGASPGAAGNAGSSMFSPFSSSAMPFPFTPSDMSLGKPDAAALNSAFAQPLRRPDGMQGGVPPGFAPGAPPPLGHAPPGGCRRTPPPTMPPKSEPVQSALAPKPRGILKNAKPPADAQEKNKCVDVC